MFFLFLQSELIANQQVHFYVENELRNCLELRAVDLRKPEPPPRHRTDRVPFLLLFSPEKRVVPPGILSPFAITATACRQPVAFVSSLRRDRSTDSRYTEIGKVRTR